MEDSLAPDFTGSQVGNWTLRRRIGVGAFGSVYEAHNEIIDKAAAVKVLHPQMMLHKKTLQRFLGEASAASKARHPGIVEFYDGGFSQDGRCYMVMELLRGSTLQSALEGGPLGPARTARLGQRLAAALAAVHARNIVHRDLKPENIFLLEPGDNVEPDTPKILDFGIAKLRSAPRRTVDGTLLGTPPYMSPEQCATEPNIDQRSDIYSLGIILYECLVGAPPFQEQALHAWLFAHMQKPVPDPAARRPDAPPALCQLLLRMLQKAPADRPQSMEEVARSLQAIGTPEAATVPFSRIHLDASPAPPPSEMRHAPISASSPSLALTSPRLPRAVLVGATAAVLLAASLGGYALLRPPSPKVQRAAAAIAEPSRPAPTADPALAAKPSPALPATLVPMDGFAIEARPVSIGDFHLFAAEQGLRRAARWPWEFNVPEHLPMNAVSPALATRYCQWHYPRLGGRLPTKAELAAIHKQRPPAPGAPTAEWTTVDSGDRSSVKVIFRCATSLPSPGGTP